MTNTNKVTLAALQILAASGSIMGAVDQQTITQTPKEETQNMVNQLSLASIEQSWLAIPRICKAVGFNADPAPLKAEVRSAAVSSLYSAFAV